MPSPYETRIEFMMGAGIEAWLDGDYQLAEDMFKSTISCNRCANPFPCPAIGECLVHLGNVKMAQSKLAQAAAFYKLAVCVFKQSKGDDHINVFLARAKLHKACQGQEAGLMDTACGGRVSVCVNKFETHITPILEYSNRCLLTPDAVAEQG